MKKAAREPLFFFTTAYLPLEPVLLPELELVSLGELVLLDPLVPPVLPGVLVLPPVPLVPAALPEVPDEAEDFLAFLCFLAFFFFGVVAPAPVSLWPEDEAADGVVLLLGVAVLAPEPDVPLVSPEAPVELLPPVEEPLLMPLPLVPLVPLAPDAPLLEVPDAPEESVPPDMPLDDVPLVPLLPEEDAPGVEEEVPELPDMPAPVAPVELCEAGLEEVEDGLLVSVEELCASAIEDTDAIRTIDKDRNVVFNVMRNSFG